MANTQIVMRSNPLGIGTLTVNPSQTFQTSEGFGASDRDEAVALTDPLADLFFSTTPGSGSSLSILRASIDPDGAYTSFIGNVGKAAARGAKIIAAPWSAPGAFKTNGVSTDGGHLLSADYNAWATTMAGFQATIVGSQAVTLYGIEVQNEPDFTAPYDSMLYTNAEMASFIDVLGPKLAALSPVPKLVTPSTASWDNVSGYTAAIAWDATAKSYTYGVSTHQYAGTPATDANLPTLPFWQTEMSYFNAFDTTMTQALIMASDMYTALTTANVSMWCYWMLNGNSTDNEGLVGQNSDYTITKRLYVMGNFSAFIRPGMVRIAIAGTLSGVQPVAYVNTTTQDFAIVCVNQNSTAVAFTLGLGAAQGPHVHTVTPWLTDASHNLTAQTAVPVSGAQFWAQLPALSVTSFVGNGL